MTGIGCKKKLPPIQPFYAYPVQSGVPGDNIITIPLDDGNYVQYCDSLILRNPFASVIRTYSIAEYCLHEAFPGFFVPACTQNSAFIPDYSSEHNISGEMLCSVR